MSNYKTARRALPSISLGFVHGLAQMSSIGHVHPIGRPMRAKSAADSLREDWIRLGGDMALAIEKVHERGAEKSNPE